MPELVSIAVLGESPNDTEALISLLNQRFSGEASFFSMLSKVRGSNIDTADFPKRVRLELQFAVPKPRILVVVRDLDALHGDKHQREVRQYFFKRIRSAINEASKSERKATGKGKSDSKFCFLLCIYEFEALIMADVEVFNHEYGTSLAIENPEKIAEPKEVLKEASKKAGRKEYGEPDCRDIFPLLRIDTVAQNSTQFRKFLAQLGQSIEAVAVDN